MHRWINVSLQSSQPNPSFYWYGETLIVHSLNPCFILSCTFIGPAKTYVRTVLTLFALSNQFLDYVQTEYQLVFSCSLHTFNWKSGYKLSVVVFLFPILCRNRHRNVSTLTMLQAGWSRVPILEGARDFSLLQNVQTDWSPPSLLSLGNTVCSQE
jgi:hypothetical protein